MLFSLKWVKFNQKCILGLKLTKKSIYYIFLKCCMRIQQIDHLVGEI